MTSNVSKQQCTGRTAKGGQCSRSACENEIYCKTHIKKYSKSKYPKDDREVNKIIYHTHPPSKKLYPGCPRCEIKQKELSSSTLLGIASLQIEEQTPLCVTIP